MQSYDELYNQLINWHKLKHLFSGDNSPSQDSAIMLQKLVQQILLPLSENLGAITITYGFTNAALTRFIQKESPSGTAPILDQHACAERNTKGNTICSRNGAACDFVISSYDYRMHEVALFICQHLSFDKLYFYGRCRPIHISVSDERLRHLQIMQQSLAGRRYPGKKAKGDKTIALAKEL
ncbi:hypothetical protein LMJ53_14170 [Rheinheimera sp. UJ51]|uniref:hypothetical protein n=1 Tax=Rheinheimera sp. UJ51 TaxID=2892446 RepID=UPI001E416713|nr:hypothetical protein [Rheinheimera sp. UJ51]MCC5452870.1 hypothetical protein [Rheinheimera sp. UJ51]